MSNDRRLPPMQSSVTAIASSAKSDAQRNPKLQRLIVWDRLTSKSTDTSDKVKDALGAGWQRVSDVSYRVRDHWTWREMFVARRRVYERTGPSATSPSSRPASTVPTTQSD
jgi:hypothetical protein